MRRGMHWALIGWGAIASGLLGQPAALPLPAPDFPPDKTEVQLPPSPMLPAPSRLPDLDPPPTELPALPMLPPLPAAPAPAKTWSPAPPGGVVPPSEPVKPRLPMIDLYKAPPMETPGPTVLPAPNVVIPSFKPVASPSGEPARDSARTAAEAGFSSEVIRAFAESSIPGGPMGVAKESPTGPVAPRAVPIPVAYDPEHKAVVTTEAKAPDFLPGSKADPKRAPAPAALPPAFPGVPEFKNPEPMPVGTVIVEPQTWKTSVAPARLWMRAEYLMWWVKDAPLGVSLVTTGNPNNNPGAELLNSDRGYDNFSGLRLSVGGWCDECQNLGVDASWFFLGQRTNSFFTASDSTGNPTLAFPFTSNAPGAVGAYVLPVTSPGAYSGNVLVASSLSLWGGEVNGAFCLFRDPGFELSALVGFRYADLRETLDITSVASDLSTSPNTVSILGDSFNTRNQFYGGQIASRFNWHGDALSFDVTAKLALGSTHQVVDIQGTSSQFGPTQPNGVFPSGFFAQGSNIGRYTGNQFTVIPSVEMKLNWLISSRLKAFVGYDFLYWNQVVRPGTQVDRTLNLTQSPLLGFGTLTGPASPGPLYNRTDFWAHGVSFGLEMRF